MKKFKYQQYFHCFAVCILVPYAFWFGYWKNILTAVLSAAAFKTVVLITGRGLF